MISSLQRRLRRLPPRLVAASHRRIAWMAIMTLLIIGDEPKTAACF